MHEIELTHRVAQLVDLPAIEVLMRAAICRNIRPFLSTAEIEAVQTMGVDCSLIADQTYFVIETRQAANAVMVGCGGWGKRKTLYGGHHTQGIDDALSDPDTDATSIRAMYAHPDWTRRGIGSLLLTLGEQAARETGFKTHPTTIARRTPCERQSKDAPG
jgi:GNAT superfamily N-acetyltransferase